MLPFLSSRSFLRQLDLTTLDLFVLTCETGSLAKAAERGQLATSAISKRITELESLAGTPLLLRHARGVRPTTTGELLMRHANAILLGVEDLRADLSEYARGMRGLVRLSANASAVEQFLPEDIAAFTDQNPEIRIDLRQATSRMVARAVRDGTAELGICSPSDEALGLEVRPYRQERLVLVMPRDHALSRHRKLAYEQTLDYAQIGLRDSSLVRETLSQEAHSTRRALRQRIEVDSLSAMCRMIECGLGVGVMPEGAVRSMGEPRRLRAAFLTNAWADRTLNLYAMRFEDLPAAACNLVTTLSSNRCSVTECSDARVRSSSDPF